MTTEPEVAATPDPAPDDGGRKRGAALWLALAALAVVLLPATLVAASVLGSSDDAPEELVVEIPAGTWDRIQAGEDVEILPEEVRLDVGDRILLKNDDDKVHTVGPMTVRPGESLLQVFGQAGRFEGNCTLLPERKVVITVT